MWQYLYTCPLFGEIMELDLNLLKGKLSPYESTCEDGGGTFLWNIGKFLSGYAVSRGRDSSVGIAIRYGLEGPGIESRWGRDFPHPSRPALGPTQPPEQLVPGLSRG